MISYSYVYSLNSSNCIQIYISSTAVDYNKKPKMWMLKFAKSVIISHSNI